MHRRALPVCLSLAWMFVWAAPARADEAPSPREIRQPPPPTPATVETPAPTKAEPAPTKTEPAPPIKADAPPPARAADTKKMESGGMCSVGAPAGGWALLALVGPLLVRRRRRA